MFARSLLAAGMMCLSGLVHAHAHLTASSPREGSSVASPARIELVFSESARLTLLTLRSNGAAARRITDLPRGPGRVLAVTIPALPAGACTVSWRVLADDGHVMSGALHFTVLPGAAAP